MLKFYKVLIILSGIFTCYQGVVLVKQIKYVPAEFSSGLIIFIIFLGLTLAKADKTNVIIKIDYENLHESFNELLDSISRRFYKYKQNDDIKEIKPLKQEIVNYISVIALVINTHQRQFALKVLRDGFQDSQTHLNEKFIKEIQKDYLLMEQEISNYLYERN